MAAEPVPFHSSNSLLMPPILYHLDRERPGRNGGGGQGDTKMIAGPGRPLSSFRSTLDRFHDASSSRKSRCRRDESDYRDIGPCKYERPSMLELQQTRPKTMGSVIGGSAGHRSVVARKGSNWYPGRKDYPHLGPGSHHKASRMFLTKKEAIMFLPGSRRGFHSFLNSGRSRALMGDAVLFRTGRDAGQHLGPGSYDLPCSLKNGIRPSAAPGSSVWDNPSAPALSEGTSKQNVVPGARRGCLIPCRRVRQLPEEWAADVQAVRALPALG